ncbi:hypothetical protein DM860_006710 [Cuscuta australis]|uniref:Uncharacterized protein n=1 Tax=Cuscuta australis TaxID=267555 RepID=A0A328D662_9ASTE|nr:hypothetical protein DM860_006710 [Cuscuta australis]
MNGMSGYPSKKQETGEEHVSFDSSPLLSCICEMDYLPRTFGEKVKFDRETLSRKYILFYCFFQPPRHPFAVLRSCHPISLFKLCTDLYSVRDDFEMVSIVRMSEEHDCEELIKWLAFSAPTYSLVVPAEESHRRNVMCECLDVLYPGSLKCLLVNVEKGIVVHGGLDSMSCLTEHLQKLQKESSLDWLRSSERVFKMLWPVIPEEQENPFPLG